MSLPYEANPTALASECPSRAVASAEHVYSYPRMEGELGSEKQAASPDHQHALPPAVMTAPCQRYFEDNLSLTAFVGFVSHLATERDETAKVAAQALYETAHDDDERERHRVILERGGVGALKTLRSFAQLLLKLVAARGADDFLLYISELLALVFRSRPETLRSSEQVRLDLILQHDTMEDLVSDLAERKVQALSYQGMRSVATWVEERLGLKLLANPASLDRAVRIVEVRNLIAHNRAVVNRLFLTRIPDGPAAIGDVLNLNVDDVFDDLEFLGQAVADLDERSVAKFGLAATIKREDLQPLPQSSDG
jgi:hypothetical protein